MKNFKITKITTFIILLVLFFSATLRINPVKAQGGAEDQTITVGEKKAIDLDGDSYDDVLVEALSIDPLTGRPVIKTTSLVPSQAGGSQYISSPFIAQYISAMYKYAVAIISVLSVILIIFAGVRWIISGGSPDKINNAKQMIARSLTGLVIALGSYVLLATINPDLVTFRNLEVLRASAVVIIPQDRTMPDGVPNDPPEKLASINNLSANLSPASGVDMQATDSAAAALKSALDEFFNNPSNKDIDTKVILSTAYRSPISQYSLMVEQCGCKTVDELLNPKDEEGKPIIKDGKAVPTEVEAGKWSSHCTNINNCKVGYKTLALKDGKFQAPNIAHFGGTAFDISVALTGAIKPCGDISIDALARKSDGVVNAGQYKKDWCIPKQQQLLIKAMLKNNFCVGLKGTVREPWHFEHTNGLYQSNFCTYSVIDQYMEKLEYLKDIK